MRCPRHLRREVPGKSTMLVATRTALPQFTTSLNARVAVVSQTELSTAHVTGKIRPSLLYRARTAML